MPLVYNYNITITELAQEYMPHSIVRKYKNTEIIIFTWHQIIYKQAEIAYFWRLCNQYHLKPVAKTFFGRIRAIKIVHEI